jgi:hypothetical protein
VKEDNIEELKQLLEELYRTQQARLDVGADDLDIREEIAEVEEEIKELQDEINIDREDSIKNEQSSIEEDINRCNKLTASWIGLSNQLALKRVLSDYKRVLKENEELTISNKEIDKECSRLEKKEIELINENEHYKDLIYALKTYYDITEEDLEKCMKNDR